MSFHLRKPDFSQKTGALTQLHLIQVVQNTMNTKFSVKNIIAVRIKTLYSKNIPKFLASFRAQIHSCILLFAKQHLYQEMH